MFSNLVRLKANRVQQPGSRSKNPIHSFFFFFFLFFFTGKWILKNYLSTAKGLVHPKMKSIPSFTHPQAILGVYDFLLSDEYNQSYINKHPDASELYNGSELQPLQPSD